MTKQKRMITISSLTKPIVMMEARLLSDREAILDDLRKEKFKVIQTGPSDYTVLRQEGVNKPKPKKS